MSNTTMLNEDLNRAIKEHLPGLIGDQLKNVLDDYERMKADYAVIDRNYGTLSNSYNDLLKKDRQYDANQDKAKELNAKEKRLDVQEEVLKIREKHAQERVEEIRRLTDTVFQSNRMNYNVALNKSKYTPASHENNYVAKNENETITGTVGSID